MGEWRRILALLLNLGLVLLVSAQENDVEYFASGGGETLEQRERSVRCADPGWTYDNGDGSGPQIMESSCVDIVEFVPLSDVVETQTSDEPNTDRRRWCPTVPEYNSEEGVREKWGFCISIQLGAGGGFQQNFTDGTPSLAPSQEGIRFTDGPTPFDDDEEGSSAPSTEQDGATDSPATTSIPTSEQTEAPIASDTESPAATFGPVVTDDLLPTVQPTLVPAVGPAVGSLSPEVAPVSLSPAEFPAVAPALGPVAPNDAPALGTQVPTPGVPITAPVVSPNETETTTPTVEQEGNETTTSPAGGFLPTEEPTIGFGTVVPTNGVPIAAPVVAPNETETSTPTVEQVDNVTSTSPSTSSPTSGNETVTDVPSVPPANSTEAPVPLVDGTFAPTSIENITSPPTTATGNSTEGNITAKPTPLTASNETTGENATKAPVYVSLAPTPQPSVPPTLFDESNAPLGSADLNGFDDGVAGGTLEVVILPNDTIRVSGFIIGLPVSCSNCFIGLHDGYSCREVSGVDSPGELYSSSLNSTNSEPELVPISTDALGVAEVNVYLKGNGREESALTKTVLVYAPQTLKPTYMPSPAPSSLPSSGENITETDSNQTEVDPTFVPSIEPTPMVNDTESEDDGVDSGPFAIAGWLKEPGPCAKQWNFYAEGETEPVALSGCALVSEYEPYLGGNQKAELPSEGSGGDPTRWCPTIEDYYVEPPPSSQRILRKLWGYCLETMPDSEEPGRILQDVDTSEVGSSPISCGKVVPLKGPNDGAIQFGEILPVGWPEPEPQVTAELEGDGYITVIPGRDGVWAWDFSEMVSEDSEPGGAPTTPGTPTLVPTTPTVSTTPTTSEGNETVVPTTPTAPTIPTTPTTPEGNETVVPTTPTAPTTSEGNETVVPPTPTAPTTSTTPTTPEGNETVVPTTPTAPTTPEGNETVVPTTSTAPTTPTTPTTPEGNETVVPATPTAATTPTPTTPTDVDTDVDNNPYGPDNDDDDDEVESDSNGTDTDDIDEGEASPDNLTISEPENQRRSLQLLSTGFRVDFLRGGCVNGTIVSSRFVADPAGSFTGDDFADVRDMTDLSVLVTNRGNESIQSCADLEAADIPRGSLITYTEPAATTTTVVVSGTGFQPGLIAVGVPCDQGVPFNVSEDGSFMLEYQVPIIIGEPEVCITESATNLQTADGIVNSETVEEPGGASVPTFGPTTNGTTGFPTDSPTRNGTSEAPGPSPGEGDDLALALGLGLGLGIPTLLVVAILAKRRSRRNGGAPKADRSYGSPSETGAKSQSSFGRLRSTLSTKG